MALAIRTDACALDFLALGALVHRLDPGVIPFRKARSVEIHVSGGEYNVAANLSDCFGLKTGICTAMVRYPIGDLVQARVREMGVQAFYKYFDHDGVRGPNIATVYSDRGYGVRPPIVFYNRANEAAALLRPGDFDWSQIFGQGVRWFHSGGIFASLSETTAELIIEAMQAGGGSHQQNMVQAVTTVLSLFIGAISFSGSLVAFAKLQELMTGRPITYFGQKVVNLLLLAGCIALMVLLCAGSYSLPLFLTLLAASLAIGILLVLPIGGADMPVVISLLNSFTGCAAGLAGFVLLNTALLIEIGRAHV